MRRHFMKSIAGLFVGYAFSQQNTKKKFYITGLYHGSDFNDCTLPPVVVYGADRIDALASSGLTVWTEDEWENFQKKSGKQFRDGCKETGRKE